MKITNSNEFNDISTLSTTILNDFHISPILFIVPILVISCILKISTNNSIIDWHYYASILALLFQNDILQSLNESNYISIVQSIFTDSVIQTSKDRKTVCRVEWKECCGQFISPLLRWYLEDVWTPLEHLIH